MTNVSVEIPKELASFLRAAVKEGRFSGMGDAVASALYALRDQVELERMKEDRLRHAVMLGMDQCARGEADHYDQGVFLRRLRSGFRPEAA